MPSQSSMSVSVANSLTSDFLENGKACKTLRSCTCAVDLIPWGFQTISCHQSPKSVTVANSLTSDFPESEKVCKILRSFRCTGDLILRGFQTGSCHHRERRRRSLCHHNLLWLSVAYSLMSDFLESESVCTILQSCACTGHLLRGLQTRSYHHNLLCLSLSPTV